MQITVNQSRLNGKVKAPPSKSYTIRGLMCAALAEGQSRLLSPLESEDTQSAVRVLRQIGIDICIENTERWKVQGGRFRTPREELFCGDSAATLRFMTALCALMPGISQLTAGESLARRPLKTLVEALRLWGVDVSAQGEYPPVRVIGGSLEGGTTSLRGDISSQYVSALLLAAPLSRLGGQIRLTAPLESRPYVQMTIQCLKQFGIEVEQFADMGEFHIRPQRYQPAEYQVEGDWSSASYLMAFGAVAGGIEVSNLNIKSLQGDKVLPEFLKQMGVGVEIGENNIGVRQENLKSIQADLNNCIDLLPTMAVLAALAHGASCFTGIGRARLKESNRIAALRQGLESMGIRVVEEPDSLTIEGGRPRAAVIDADNDHRIAMAFSLVGAAVGGITIRGAECVSKTFPEYWRLLTDLGVRMDEQ
jgi:3-phosphoshikimate 1-carboxyvinyltransferase